MCVCVCVLRCLSHFSGPKDVKIEDSDKAIATATNLHIEGTSPTMYTFQLNVTNYRHLSSQSTVNVTVCKGEATSLCVVCACEW